MITEYRMMTSNELRSRYCNNAIIIGPNGFEYNLPNSQDLGPLVGPDGKWSGDIGPVLEELNRLYKENQELKQINKVHGSPFSRNQEN